MMIFHYPLIPTSVANFSPRMNDLVETPLDDHSRSLYTSLVYKQNSNAQLNFIIAKLSTFVLKKKYKCFPATTKVPDESNKALPKHVPPSTNPDISIVPPPTFIQQYPASYVLQTVFTNV